jgi:hypothetical protein
MGNSNRLELQAKIESGVAILTAALFVLTLFTREWIEALTGWDPDHGNGSLEWLIVAVLAVTAVAVGLRARTDWRKLQASPA